MDGRKRLVDDIDSVQLDVVSHNHKSQKIDLMYSESDITTIRSQILAQLFGRFDNIKLLPELYNKYQEVYRLLEHTVRDYEGNSTLIIGPRASGKTAIVETALTDITKKYLDHFITVRLNAFIHADDNVALREIARQLDINKNDDDIIEESATFEQRSINDTFANILSILEQKNADPSLRLAIVFVIDEFERFTTSSNKQTLLYNLFDMTQNSSTPICVIGVLTRLTARELLEKRVKSRFSQRIISINKCNLVDEFWKEARLNFIVNEKVISRLENEEYGHEWNRRLDELYESPSNLRKLVYQNYFSVKNIKELNNSLVYAILRVNPQQAFPLDTDISVYPKAQMTNNVQAMVSALLPLELLLVIAAARWIEKYELQVINFNLAYAEYKDMIKRYNISATSNTMGASGLDSKVLTNIKINQRVWLPQILTNSWEFLYKLGILLDASGVTTNNDGHIITNISLNKNLVIEDSRLVQLDITLDELAQLLEGHSFKKMTQL